MLAALDFHPGVTGEFDKLDPNLRFGNGKLPGEELLTFALMSEYNGTILVLLGICSPEPQKKIKGVNLVNQN